MRKIALVGLVIAIGVVASAARISARPNVQPDNLLQLLPDGTTVLLVDFRKVTSSSLWATLSTQNQIKSTIQKMETGIAEMGLSLSDIHSAAVVFSSGVNNATAAVAGNFNQSELLARARANQKIKLTSEKYRNFDVYKVQPATQPASQPADQPAGKEQKGHDASFVFYDAGTVIAGSSAGVRAAIDIRADGKPGVAQNARLAEAIAQNPTAAVRFAMEVTPAAAKSLPTGGVPLPDFSSLKMVFGSVDVATGLDINATLRNDTAENARLMAERLNGLLEMARGFLGASGDQKMAGLVTALKTVTIINADVDVKVAGNLPLEVLTQVLR